MRSWIGRLLLEMKVNPAGAVRRWIGRQIHQNEALSIHFARVENPLTCVFRALRRQFYQVLVAYLDRAQDEAFFFAHGGLWLGTSLLQQRGCALLLVRAGGDPAASRLGRAGSWRT